MKKIAVLLLECNPGVRPIARICNAPASTDSIYAEILGMDKDALSDILFPKGMQEPLKPMPVFVYLARFSQFSGQTRKIISHERQGEDGWSGSFKNIVLSEDQIHVWCVTVGDGNELIKYMKRLLSAYEDERTKKFYLENDRMKFSHTRGWLRIILGQYLGVAPEKVQFKNNDYGKLYLDEKHGSDIRFSVSHSGKIALYAFCRKTLGLTLNLFVVLKTLY